MIEEFKAFPKIPRLSRDIVISEKLDGTNASVWISDDGLELKAASRTRFITPQADNYGFAKWVEANREELLRLGPGTHFGEWWGQGIQRGYGLKEKRFSLFNTEKWSDPVTRPTCCSVVPVLYTGSFSTTIIDDVVEELRRTGSFAAPCFKNPEGIIIYHTAGNLMFKKTLEKDESPKTLAA